MDDVKNIAQQEITFKPSVPGKITPKTGILEDEVESATLNSIGNPSIKKLKIVADPGNAMGVTIY